jgi:chromosome segregation ATPase
VSEPTRVGLGVAETRFAARNGDTPPSGIPMQLARGDVSIILERLIAAEEKIDALISDGRGDRAKLDGIRRELRTLRLYAVRVAQHGEAHAKELDEIKGHMLALAGQIATVVESIGKAPQKLSERQSQQGELTKEELEQLEQGTGLAGVVGRLVAGQKRLERRVGTAAVLGGLAASSPSWAPAVVDVVSKLFGGH